MEDLFYDKLHIGDKSRDSSITQNYDKSQIAMLCKRRKPITSHKLGTTKTPNISTISH